MKPNQETGEAIARVISDAEKQTGSSSTAVIIIQMHTAPTEPPPSYASLYPDRVDTEPVIQAPIVYLGNQHEEEFIHPTKPAIHVNLESEQSDIAPPVVSPLKKMNLNNYLGCVKHLTYELWSHCKELSPKNVKSSFFKWTHSSADNSADKHRPSYVR